MISPALGHLLSLEDETAKKRSPSTAPAILEGQPILTYTFETSWSTITLEVAYDPNASPDPNDGNNDVNSDFCCVCAKPGSLAMCDFCANSFHLGEAGQSNCHPKAASLAESAGQVRCPDCLAFNETKERLKSMKKPNSTSSVSSWNSSCLVCNDGGDLLCCLYCPATIHASCASAKDRNGEEWTCLDCSTMLNKHAFRFLEVKPDSILPLLCVKARLLTPYKLPAAASASIENFPLSLSNCKTCSLGSSYLSLLLLASQAYYPGSAVLVQHQVQPYAATVTTLSETQQTYHKIVKKEDYEVLVKKAGEVKLVAGVGNQRAKSLIFVRFAPEYVKPPSNSASVKPPDLYTATSKVLLKRGVECALRQR